MKIILSGGGTLGPVMPLLAIVEICRKRNSTIDFVWVGTRRGPERQIIEKYDIRFVTMFAGKLRRYFSFWNFVDLLKIILAFFQSFVLLIKERPVLIISAGGFVSVPLHWAAACLGIPSLVHQQDARVGLANKLMAFSADKITTALAESVKYFPSKKTEWIGNPVRDLRVTDVKESRRKLGLPEEGVVILAMGGGTGSSKINKLVVGALNHWPRDWQVVHLVGKERPSEFADKATSFFPNYHVHKFFNEEMKDAYAAADVVIARAGFCTITELASLSKAAVLLPISNTHQEDNVKKLAESRAVVVFDENNIDGLQLAHVVREMIDAPNYRRTLGEKLHIVLPPAKEEKIIEIIERLTGVKW